MFTTAVVGPPLPEPPAKALIADALADTLPPVPGQIRILVPVADGSLTEGVRAVVEWAWMEARTNVIAVHNGQVGGDTESQFIETGADGMIQATDIVGVIGRQLLDALPDACLVVALGDAEPDDLTRNLADLCSTLKIPVYDICRAAIPLSPHDLSGWEDSEPEPEPETAIQEESAPAVEELETARMAVATVPAGSHEVDFATALREERRGWVRVEKIATEHINDIDDQLNHGKPPYKPRHNGILISYDGGLTKQPRGRGKAKKGSIEYDARTLKEIRRN